MSKCILCGKYRYGRPICTCDERYQADIAAGLYPPGLTEEGKRCFGYSSWRIIKEAEARMQKLQITPAEATAIMQKTVEAVNAWPEKQLVQLEKQQQASKLSLY